jgi:hypothetical protein
MTALFLILLQSPAAWAADPLLDIHSPAELEAKRAVLVNYIWGTGWADVLAKQPTTVQPLYMPTPADALPSVSNVSRIEQLVTTMSLPALSGASSITHTSTAYLYHPQSPNGRVVIVHHGHGCALDGSGPPYNLDKTIQGLVAANYAVVAMRMPLWQRPSLCGSDATSTSHGDMFTDPQRPRTGSPLQFFLEPIARALNYIQSKYPTTYHDFNMVGLSGGGWTTTVYSALDPRITLSFPVAGSIPLDVPGFGSRDEEQYLAPFYDLAGYRDLYVMGGYGHNRRQTQILNHHDDCCFTPPDQDAFDYACQVQSSLFSLGPGAFALDYDDTSTSHQISLTALSSIILKTLEAGSAGRAPGSCTAQLSWPSGSLVHIVNQHSGKCMDVAGASTADQAKVQQFHCHNGKNQIWILERNGEIVSLNSGKCLDVPSGSLDDSVLLQQFTCHGGTNQLWRATPRGEVINVNSGKCLDLPSGDVADQVQLQQYRCNYGTNQQWVFP